MKHIFGMGSSSIENYNDNDFYSYLQKNDLIYIHTKKSIILNQSDTKDAENLTCRESPSSYTA